jgi:superfamily II DNA or RNA helicase
MGALIIHKLGLRTLWVVHSADLVKQTCNFIKNYLGIEAGAIGAGHMTVKTITVATAQSLHKRWGQLQERNWIPDLLITDEAHHSAGWHNFQALMKVPAYYRYGLSATAYRFGSEKLILEAAFGSVISTLEIKELQDQGYLAKIAIQAHKTPGQIDQSMSSWEKIYKAGIVNYEPRNEKIKEVVADLVKQGRQVLVDLDETSHLEILKIDNATQVSGSVSPKERFDIYEKFKSGDIKVLIGTVLREGLDLPNVGAVVLAGGMKSKVKVIQEIGRGFRPSEGKTECLIVDFVDEQHHILFEHSQARFITLRDAGFAVPDGIIRQITVETDDLTLQAEKEIAQTLKRNQAKSKKRGLVEADDK